MKTPRYQAVLFASIAYLSLAACTANSSANCAFSEPVRPGHGVTVPVAIHRVEPERPVGVFETGRVLLEMVIDTTGVPRDIVVLESPHPKLSEVSVEAAKAWRFRPGTCRGAPAPVVSNIQITFK